MMFFLKSHIPDEVLESISVSGTDSIDFHHIKSYSTETPEQHPELNVTQLPIFTHLEHANTNFVYVSITLVCNSVKSIIHRNISFFAKILRYTFIFNSYTSHY